MRNLFLAAIAALGLSSVANAQYPAQPQQPVQPVSGVNVIKGSGGCATCNTPVAGPATRGFTMAKLKGDGCGYGQACANGCGSVKSDIAFQFGSCKDFFSPCGPRCPSLPFAQPHGTGWGCPRAYDSYTNH